MVGPRARPLHERIWAKIDVRGPDECWEWSGTKTKRGYAMYGGSGAARGYVMRYVLEEALGRPLADGMVTRHTCDNPPCCNPAHLIEGTQGENLADMIARGRSNRGERHHAARLTAEQVEAIRADPRPSTAVAPEYGVSARQVRRIREGVRWRGTDTPLPTG